MKKKTLTLLEVVIAMSFMAVLIGVIFYNHMHIEKEFKKVEDYKHELLNRERLYFRLRQLFSHLPKNGDPIELTSPQQLIVYQEAVLDHDEKFRGNSHVLLYFYSYFLGMR